jgi:magnesium transporter
MKHRHRKSKPGTAPGIERLTASGPPEADTSADIECIDYSSTRIESTRFTGTAAFFAAQRPDWAANRWINVNGLTPGLVHAFQQRLGIHTLAAEDILSVPQRPKVESYPEHLFVVARMVRLPPTDGQQALLHDEQVSMVVTKDTLISFQESAGDVWDPLRKRLQSPASRFRANGIAYLLYALLDAIVDHTFPILEKVDDHLDLLEQQVMLSPERSVHGEIHRLKREQPDLPPHITPYYRDVYDHVVQALELLESQREIAAGLNDLYMTALSNRMNEVMKVLTIIATLFIPLTFIAGIYGMNFAYMPELAWTYGYPAVWMICLAVAGGLLLFFRRRKWI